MILFEGNPFPEFLYKAGFPEGKYVSNKEELAEARADGWSQTPIPQVYPKLIPTGKTLPSRILNADGGTQMYREKVLVRDAEDERNKRAELFPEGEAKRGKKELVSA